MRCRNRSCGAETTSVIESRGDRRRRQCDVCRERFTTYEITASDLRDLHDKARRLDAIEAILNKPGSDEVETLPMPLLPLDLDLELP